MSQHRLYNDRWKRARAAYLARFPLCSMCAGRGIRSRATVVDHIIPHRGDLEIFWDEGNWQPLCRKCHNSHKQRIEKSGRVIGCDANGIPLDCNHHWRTK